MLQISANHFESHGYKEKKKSNFICKLFKRKKTLIEKSCVKIENTFFSKMDQGDNDSGVGVTRVPSTLSVRDVTVVPCTPSPHPSTPARLRDIDTDMEALRISRHDNPFLKQVLASRESLADSLEESESDDINLMSQEFSGDFGTDPFSLPEVHQHMIRSPPPTSWPRSPNFKMFRFPTDGDQDSAQESPHRRSPSRISVSPRHDKSSEILHDGVETCFISEEIGRGSSSCAVSPRLSLNLRPHQRSSSGDSKDRSFSLLTPAPLRSLSDVRRLHSRSCEESQQLVVTEPAGKH
ncbi:uncharacterized protein LOC124353018 isoform X2 [Homalodisca vitripennis]|uniref:uncharacterized protein LOC124353018 isoform X2 n=1 Tax=Homalodisca vitripennis TaxID=197043 RepID=UPI001EEBABDC|nr:uncharacterized protein LOC124353018 isoform X2 [Homalodisca vitripennis]